MNEFSYEVWSNAYQYNENNEKDILDTFCRVAKALSSVEKDNIKDKINRSFYDIMADRYFCPAGRILANAGTNFIGSTCFNCYVGPKPKRDQDSLEGIVQVLLDQMKTLKSEGGYAMNFSFIRPRGSLIKKIGAESPGAITYIELFNKSSSVITAGSGSEKNGQKGQKNKIRKGAQLACLDCWHPDILEFIEAKRIPNRLDKFNISVGCYDDFMEKVNRVESTGIDEEWDLVFPDTTFEKYEDEWDGDIYIWKSKKYPIKVYKKTSIKTIWDKITQSTFNHNDPGVLYLDRANHTHLLNYIDPYAIRCSNACGEQMLIYGGVCDLGSLLLPFLLNEDKSDFDYNKIEKITKISVRLLDNVNDYSGAPCEEYIKNAREKRRIGLGLMGWASSLYLMKIRFASNKAELIKNKLMKCFTYSAIEASIDLAIEKGQFVGCDNNKLADHLFFKQIELPENIKERIRKHGLRNSALFSIQPNGNTSIVCENISSSTEPIYLHEWIRTMIVQSPPDHIKDLCPKYWQGEFIETEMFKFHKEGEENILKGIDPATGIVYKIDKNRGLTKEVLCEDYSVHKLKELNEWDTKAEWAVTTNDLTVEDHITDLKGFALFIDSSVSKTFNVPNNYKYNSFKKIYLDAYNSRVIKGVTTYREGTMTNVLAPIKKDNRRPKRLPCHIYYPVVKGKKFFVAVGLKEDKSAYEIFCGEDGFENKPAEGFIQRLGQGKYVLISNNEVIVSNLNDLCSDEEEALSRMTSISLRNNVPLKDIINQLEKVKGSINIYAKIMCRILRRYLDKNIESNDNCPECGKKLLHESSCLKCLCGFSKC